MLNIELFTNAIMLQIISFSIVLFLQKIIIIEDYIRNIFKVDPLSRIKPIDCELCFSFWIGTIVAAITLNPFLFFTNIIISYIYGLQSTK
jgi:hypothetical protein